MKYQIVKTNVKQAIPSLLTEDGVRLVFLRRVLAVLKVV